mgnify:CR=1 FL=1
METMIFKAPKELKERVKKIAKKEKRTPSDMSRLLIESALKIWERK